MLAPPLLDPLLEPLLLELVLERPPLELVLEPPPLELELEPPVLVVPPVFPAPLLSTVLGGVGGTPSICVASAAPIHGF